MMRAIGNLLWFILGGVWMGLAWWIAGLLAYVSVVGIPWGKACLVIGRFTFFPFGKEGRRRKEQFSFRGEEDLHGTSRSHHLVIGFT